MSALQRIAVGKRGTRPVSKYSINIGIPKIIETNAKIIDKAEKTRRGRSSLTNITIILKIFSPSLIVFSLDIEPSGRGIDFFPRTLKPVALH